MSDIVDRVLEENSDRSKNAEEELGALQKRLAEVETKVPATATGSDVVDQLLSSYYPRQVLENMKLTQAQVEGIKQSLLTVKGNVLKTAGALRCQGPKCPFSNKCPLYSAGIAPLGHACPIELMLIDMWEDQYIQDLGVNKNNKIEVDMIRDMVDSDLLDWRASNELSEHGLFDWIVVGTDTQGKPIMSKQESISIGIKLKFKARKDKIREDMMATRKIREKFGLGKDIDPSKHASDLNEKYKRVKKIHDAQFTEIKSD